MGLFSDIKQVVKKNAADAVDDKISAFASSSIGQAAMNAKGVYDAVSGKQTESTTIRPWIRKPYAGTVKPTPFFEGTFYVYYPEPLRAIRKDARFLLEAVPGDVTLHSAYSGNSLDTEESRMIAYMYNGKVVGCSKYFYEAIRERIEYGFRVFVEAEKRGVFDKDIPDIYIYGNRNPHDFEYIDVL